MLAAMTTPPPDLNQRVAEAIRAELARQGLRYRDLADKLGRTDTWVSRRLSPRSGAPMPLDLLELAEIAGALELEPAELIREAEA